MNMLSMISVIIYTSFFIGAIKHVTAERKSVLNISAFAVLLTLGWWSFCNSFFYVANTMDGAWFWHRLGSIGWCGFPSLTTYYFFALINRYSERQAWWKKVLFFGPTVVLICVNLFGENTSLAQSIVLSKNGYGFSYTNSVTNIWLWLYLIHVFVYLGAAFFFLYQWSKKVNHKMKKRMAIEFIVLDVITVWFGVVTDVIFPITNPTIPALASVGTLLFGAGYFGIICRYDVFNINLVISAEDILKTSNNPIFVMDENSEILKYNNAAGVLLGYSKSELMGVLFNDLIVTNDDKNNDFFITNDIENLEIKIRCRDEKVKDILLTASLAKDKQHSYICTIVSCQDITRQKQFSKELELEQQKYKKLANDYQRLAVFDTLTGLPNRRYLYDVLSNYERKYYEEKKDFSVLFMDIDNFKYINDTFGHKIGDELLKETSAKLRKCIDDSEFLSRLSGDEFMIVMAYKNQSSIENKIKKINDEFSNIILLNKDEHKIQLSIGSGVFSNVEDVNKLIQVADESMYQNKRKRKQELV